MAVILRNCFYELSKLIAVCVSLFCAQNAMEWVGTLVFTAGIICNSRIHQDIMCSLVRNDFANEDAFIYVNSVLFALVVLLSCF